jgi:signal transduction histidine kinase
MMEEHSESLDPVTFRRLLALMVADSTRLARLVEDILDLSKIQRQGVSLQYARIDALAVAQHVVEGLRLAHPDKVFVLSIDEGFRSLVTDRDRIQQILLNLLGNAAKYTPQNGQITLEGRLQEENYTLRVIDSGPGIPEDQQRKIFDAFYRTQDAINFKAPGTGLGLTITQAIVRAMGGDISVANATPHGAIFTICLPQKLAA